MDDMKVLITGASTGIGEACARWLDARGHQVFAGVRRPEDAERLRSGSSARLSCVTLDVADARSIQTSFETIATTVGGDGLDGLVNNAGIAVAGPLEYVPLDALRRQLEVNVVGQIAVTQAFLGLVKKARGRVVFMGSIGGRMATPFLGPYCASKFALEAIADALRVELRPWGVHVSIIEPGSIATPIWNKGEDDARAMQSVVGDGLTRDYGAALAALRKAAAESGQRGSSPDIVAAVVEHALTASNPKTRYPVGRDARTRAVIGRLLPDRIRDRVIIKRLKLPELA